MIEPLELSLRQLLLAQGHNGCFNAAPASFPNEFCRFLARDEDGPTFQLVELTEVNTVFFNEGTLETEGVDVSFLWNWDMANWFASFSGRAGLRLNYTYLMDSMQTKFGAEQEFVGNTGFARNKGQTALLYAIGPLDFTWEWNYIGDSKPLSSDPLFSFDVGSYNVRDEDAPVILSGVPGNVSGTDTNAGIYNPIGRTWYAGLNFKF